MSSRPPLDPFALPSTTESRYRLLIVAVFAACALVAPVPSLLGAPVRDLHAVFTVTIMVLLAVTTRVLLRLMPPLKVARERLALFTARDDAEMHDAVVGMAREAGLPAPPVLRWRPLDMRRTAIAFGTRRRGYLAFSGGLAILFRSDRPAFRAVVLHELAHFRNQDVTRTYLTVATWWAFLVVLVEELAGPFFSETRLVDVVARTVALGVLVYLTRNAVLRARELYADLRAASWDGQAGALRRLLAVRPARSWLGATAGVHPSPARRLQVLDDPASLFVTTLWEVFGSGCAVGVGLQALVFLIGDVTSPGIVLAALPLAALVPVAMALDTLCIGLWRRAFVEAASGSITGAGHAATGGLALGLGIAAGLHLTFGSAVAIAGGDYPGLGVGPRDIAWDLALVAVTTLLGAWTWADARAWVPGQPAAWPRRPSLWSLLVATVALCSWVGLVLGVAGAPGAESREFLFTALPLALAGAVGMVVHPLIAPAGTGAVESRPGWSRRRWALSVVLVTAVVGALLLAASRLPSGYPTPVVGDCVLENGGQQHGVGSPVPTVGPAACTAPRALGRVVALTGPLNPFVDPSFYQPDCPDDTDLYRPVAGSGQVACIVRLRPPHEGDPGQGGGMVRAGDCVQLQGGIFPKGREVPCTGGAFWHVAARADRPDECPDTAIESLHLDADVRAIACLDGGPLLLAAGTCISDPGNIELTLISLTPVPCNRPRCGASRVNPRLSIPCAVSPITEPYGDDHVVARVARAAECPGGTTSYDTRQASPPRPTQTRVPFICLTPV